MFAKFPLSPADVARRPRHVSDRGYVGMETAAVGQLLDVGRKFLSTHSTWVILHSLHQKHGINGFLMGLKYAPIDPTRGYPGYALLISINHYGGDAVNAADNSPTP